MTVRVEDEDEEGAASFPLEVWTTVPLLQSPPIHYARGTLDCGPSQ